MRKLTIRRVAIDTLMAPCKRGKNLLDPGELSMWYRHTLANRRTTDRLSSPNDVEELVSVWDAVVTGESIDELFQCPGFARCFHFGYDKSRIQKIGNLQARSPCDLRRCHQVRQTAGPLSAYNLGNS